MTGTVRAGKSDCRKGSRGTKSVYGYVYPKRIISLTGTMLFGLTTSVERLHDTDPMNGKCDGVTRQV